MIKLIVGLGNPGSQYEKTRHNAGFLFLDHLAVSYGLGWSVSGQFQGEVASLSSGAEKLLLLKPMTFMNKSGLSVGKMLRYHKLKPEELLVVHDELELPEGVVRMKRDGGHAGHNGLRDIIAHIDSRDFFRLRMGIGRPETPGANIANYVLSRPSSTALSLFGAAFAQVETRLGLVLAGNLTEFNALTIDGKS
ncbi:aminoacyl-tRNA hydrolase [Methylomonas methanica]|uniref:Peptidyl-tRNA hydrolase n=1 Tax=Methylomonas methanica (strain DSM 25384 / MC09) TaxID=857087 RepID=F9ZXN1_METMM|nr:aminoacyl-tRNA hydrolase [Methylomonas methanica]AEG02186.1 Peptidyl-tRNA hydrolase [Methylomonas methanica MC09]